jgi:GntR family transcriptional repressor for pyruvate dehydrogenase complex
MAQKAHAVGLGPVIEEHRTILDAIASGDAEQARAAMRGHLNRVLHDLLDATEVHEIEQVRARLMENRRRYAGTDRSHQLV